MRRAETCSEFFVGLTEYGLEVCTDGRQSCGARIMYDKEKPVQIMSAAIYALSRRLFQSMEADVLNCIAGFLCPKLSPVPDYDVVDESGHA